MTSAEISTTPLEGACHCGTIRYRTSGPPTFSVICHCASCRRATGAPSVAWLTFERAQFRFIAGFPLSYQSSSGVVRRFCGTCGSALAYENALSPTTVDVTTATLEDPEQFAPEQEVWLAEKLSWQCTNPALRGFERALETPAAAQAVPAQPPVV